VARTVRDSTRRGRPESNRPFQAPAPQPRLQRRSPVRAVYATPTPASSHRWSRPAFSQA